jgi:hypothetical protein
VRKKVRKGRGKRGEWSQCACDEGPKNRIAIPPLKWRGDKKAVLGTRERLGW